jgi:hypothetical protein
VAARFATEKAFVVRKSYEMDVTPLTTPGVAKRGYNSVYTATASCITDYGEMRGMAFTFCHTLNGLSYND